ncbi:DUF1735 domain-containing protein [Niabella sp. CC-SYL272]|uniref:DUF1735 domain-containing protein n=1 Tax=Niabella agricola TaxID=2891571 RepID=UPI001F37F637|nr:DUF1735 domain-containing protein [Niabella agricola]MCF3112172.1 DUF1735 domain-containing protein [Niabella agricola]
MKSIVYLLTGCILSILVSCDKYNSGITEPAAYGNVYMPRAVVKNPYITGLPLSDTTYAFSYNAFLGGISAAGSNLNIRFDVSKSRVDSFNSRNNTAYELLPAGSYQFVQNATIPSGQRSTPILTLGIQTANIKPFKAYMLPLSIADAGGQQVSSVNGTTYYIFTRSYMADVEKRQKVLSLGAALDWSNKARIIIARGRQNTLVVRHKNNDLHLYTPQADGTYNPQSKVIGVNWADSEAWYYINETDLVVRNYPYWAGLFYFKWEPDLNMHQASPVWDEWWLGDFWDKYTTIIPFKNYFLLIDKNNGDLLRQPLLSRVTADKAVVGAGFSGYRQVLTWDNCLLALGADGNLWLYKMAADATPGERILVGTGWNRYEKLVVVGKDILALDTNGDVYRYQFDPVPYLQ